MSKKKRRKRRKTKEALTQSLSPRPVKEEAAQEAKPEKVKKKKKLPFYLFFILFLFTIAYFSIRIIVPQKRVKKDSSLNVLLITLDTTRADRLGCYGYKKAKTPHLDFLAANGIQFSNTYCQVPLTTPSHCSILTGTYPLYHRVRNNGSYSLPPDLLTLAEVLKDNGFQTGAFVSSFTVDSRFGLDQGFEVYDDMFSEDQIFKTANSERKAEKVFDAFSRWLDKNQTQPFFGWIHFYDPHIPYDPPSPFKEEFSDNLYDGEIAYMDSYVGKTVEKMREKGLLDKTFIVLAGDHGEAFGEKVEIGHGVFLYEGTMKVPLLFYAEKHLPSGVIIKSRVRLIDLVPTILDMLKIPVPKEIQGTSLLPYIQGKKKGNLSTYMETFYPRENYGWSELIGVVDGDWKYIQAPKEELYNLTADPEEMRNVLAEKKNIAQAKREKLKELIAQNSSGIKPEKRGVTSEEAEKLRALGYVDHSAGTAKGPLPDPKDQMEELRMSQQAEILEMQGNFAGAATIYEKILSIRPETPSSYVSLALMQAKMGKFEEAIRILDQGTQKIPGSEILLSRLGHTYLVTGRLQKALDTMQAVLEVNPRYFDALLASGWILDFMGKKEEARQFFEKALEIEPENKFLRKNYAINLAISGKILEAIDVYKSLKDDYPDDYEVYQDLGIAYGYAGDISNSIENLKKAVSLHPTPVSYYNLAVALKKVGNIKEAISCLRLYLENPEGEDQMKIQQAREELKNLEKIVF